MKKALTRITALVLGISAAFAMGACTNDKGGDDKVVDVRTKTLTVGYTDYAPMNYTDETGVLTGFDTELALTIFNALGYEVNFKLIDWSNKYTELDGGTIDCIWNGFTANVADDDGVERSDKVDFSYYYMTNAQCIVKQASTADVTSVSEFEGKSVGYEVGSAGESYVAALEANINKKEAASQMDAVRDVNMGTCQYAVIDLLLAKSIVGKGDYAQLSINEGIVIDAEYYAIGFKKGSPLKDKVNLMLETYAKLGYLNELAAKYGLENSVITEFSE